MTARQIFTVSCDLVPEKVTVRRWSADQYPAGADDDYDASAEDVTVEKNDDGEFVIKGVEPGYVYEVYHQLGIRGCTVRFVSSEDSV